MTGARGSPRFNPAGANEKHMIELCEVSREYRDGERTVSALRNVNLAVPRGARLALTGQSGSGKSTLLHLIGGLEQPSSGRVRVAGKALEAMTDSELTRFRLHQTGFMFQFFHLLPALSVMENLLLPTELAGVAAATAKSRARHLLQRVGLLQRAESYPERLSGGQQQRVALARALMLESPLLLADEPTGNLDSEAGQQVLDLIWSLAETQGTTVVLATHSASLADACGLRVTLRDGRIVETAGFADGEARGVAGSGPRAS